MVRDKFQPYVNKQITVSGFFDKYDIWQDHATYREYPTAVIQNVMFNGEKVCGHVWVHHAQKLKEMHLRPCTEIKFKATVKAYKKRLNTVTPEGVSVVTDYCLDFPGGIVVLDEGDDCEEETVEVADSIEEPASAATPAPVLSRYELVLAVTDLAARPGGVDKLLAVIDFLRDG